MIFTLLRRAFKLSSNFELFHHEIDKLKTIFKSNGYTTRFADPCMKKYLDNVFVRKEIVLKTSKKELICVVPFIGNKSLQLKTCLVHSKENNLKLCKLKDIFQSSCKLSSLFRYKYSLKKETHSDTPAVTARLLINIQHFFTIAAELIYPYGISNLIGKRLKSVKQSAISDHLLECNCSIDFNHFDILVSDGHKFRLLIKEGLLVKRDQPQLHKTIKSFPLKLFD